MAVLGLTLAAIGLVPSLSASQAPRAATETTLQAAFVFNFAKFAQWTGDRATAGPLTFCVLDDEAVEDALDELIRGSSIQGREVAIARGVSLDQLRICHVLYVQDIGATGQSIVEEASGSSVLTVGNGREFAEQGGVIGLFVEDGHMRFAVNLGLARSAGITLSSQLLSLAVIVGAG